MPVTRRDKSGPIATKIVPLAEWQALVAEVERLRAENEALERELRYAAGLDDDDACYGDR